jgi:hypothetical protein
VSFSAAYSSAFDVAEACPCPPLADVRAWIGVPATVITDDQLQTVIDGECAIQAALCTVPDPYPDALAQALYRRVARVVRLRSLPTGMVGDTDEYGPVQAARRDAEIERLEAVYRSVVLG